MAQYYWTPDPADIGSAPSNFTSRHGNDVLEVKLDGDGRYYVERSGATSTISVTTIDSIDGVDLSAVGDCQIFANLESSSTGQVDFRVIAKYDAASVSGRSGGLEAISSTTSAARLTSLVSGSDSNEASVNSEFTSTAERKIFQRVQTIGSAHKAKVWDGSQSEPLSWDIETTSSAGVQTSGLVGLYRWRSTAIRIYAFGVGTDGDPAPTSPVATGPVTPINPSITDILATSARLNWEQG